MQMTAIPTPQPDLSSKEQITALHEEVDRLAEKYRTPLVLCYLEGSDLRRCRKAAEMPGRHGQHPPGTSTR